MLGQFRRNSYSFDEFIEVHKFLWRLKGNQKGGKMFYYPLIALIILGAGFNQSISLADFRAVPVILNYQGYLTDTLGNPINNGSLAMIFKIYDAATGGNELWSESRTVDVDQGIFQVVLGSSNPIPDSVFTGGTDRWLELIVDGNILSPRTRITSVGYAYTATYSDTAEYARNVTGDNDWVRGSAPLDSVLFTGNYLGIARGGAGNVFYGDSVHTHVNLGVKSYTGWPGRNDKYCVVGGGYGNYSQGDYSVVAGGFANHADSTYAAVLGGNNNLARGQFSIVGGGYLNRALRYGSAVLGGQSNKVTGRYAVVGGGYFHSVEGDYSAILGGYGDTLTGNYSYLFGIKSKLTQDSTFMVDMPHIRFGDESSGYEFPTQDGSADQILLTDGNGKLFWQDGRSFSYWTKLDSVIYTKKRWGIARGNVGNQLYGDNHHTHTNLGGFGCITGTDGSNFYYITVTGGYRNTADSSYSSVVGGGYNRAYGYQAFIGGGYKNMAQRYAVVVGGRENYAAGEASFIGSGKKDTVQGYAGVIGGGLSNLVGDSDYDSCSVVGGGKNNRVTNRYAVITGGSDNEANGKNSFVGGGYNNIANAYYTTVCGGYQNQATVSYGFVGGGVNNRNSGDRAAIVAGTNNYVSGWQGFVGAGEADTVLGRWGVIGGGRYNQVGYDTYDSASVVVGGWGNTAYGSYSFVGGGRGNICRRRYSFVGGGKSNQAYVSYCIVVGGEENRAGSSDDDTAAVIVGGRKNCNLGRYSFIGGGYRDTVYSLGNYSVVVGGSRNIVENNYDVVVGGVGNRVSGRYASVVGGWYNDNDADYSFIGGGTNNHIASSGDRAIIYGGDHNSLNGGYSVILGGKDNDITTAATFSGAFGEFVYLNSSRRFAIYDGSSSGHLGVNRDDNDGGINYPIHVGTSTSNGNGAYLSAGGVWTNASSRSVKENFQELDGSKLLNDLKQLPILRWRFKGSQETHIGPVAEDFYRYFHCGTGNLTDDSTHIAASDMAGVSLRAIQELIRIVEDQQKEIDRLRKEVAQLREINAEGGSRTPTGTNPSGF